MMIGCLLYYIVPYSRVEEIEILSSLSNLMGEDSNVTIELVSFAFNVKKEV